MKGKDLSLIHISLYNDYALRAAEILHQQCRYEDLVALCEQAVEYDQFDERIHRYLMEGYAGTGQNNRALAHYNYITNLFYKEFGVSLSEETKRQHKTLVEAFHNLEMDLSIIRDELKETYIQNKGAYFCDDYEVFKNIYRVQARMITRTGPVSYTHLRIHNCVCYAQKSRSCGYKVHRQPQRFAWKAESNCPYPDRQHVPAAWRVFWKALFFRKPGEK